MHSVSWPSDNAHDVASSSSEMAFISAVKVWLLKKKRAHTHMQMCSYIYILCFLQIVCPLHEQYYMIEITIMVFLCHWVACWVDCCVCVVTLVLCERASQSAHVYWCSIVCVYVCVFLWYPCTTMCTPLSFCASVCTSVHLRACSLSHLCYSLSIVNKSVEQDPDPPVGTNHTHSSGLNSQLTIRAPLSPCLLVRHT